MPEAIKNIKSFLFCETPQAWIKSAVRPENLSLLLIDHANCEKKAASTAVNLIYRYIDKFDVMTRMSKLAREELRHFEQVLLLLKKRGLVFAAVKPSRYAGSLHQHVRTHEPKRLVDAMIVGAIIEARSCERFAALAPHLDGELKKFYESLLKSESRHFKDYLALAQKYSHEQGCDEGIDDRVRFFLEIEKQLIESEDREFRFHSGIPVL
jgi:tRNA 2-(methylsulfanyl)-N6-isopentenyladenosine37 hydroxylase